MKQAVRTPWTLRAVLLIAVLIYSAVPAGAQATKWMSAGSLHNWYSSMGCEIEEGRIKEQQDGLQWPAIYDNEDMQAAKGLWIGTQNWSDRGGTVYPVKVVHVGPRVDGKNEFFPLTFEMVGKFKTPFVSVDGNRSFSKPVDINREDPTILPDRMLINTVNTAIGVTMERKIMEFSQGAHDNYIVTEYTFTNTGNVNDDATIELPGQTLSGLYFYFQYRLSVCADTRYVIGNATGWGINAMLDTRGDGVKVDPPDQQFRAQYVWHGKYKDFTRYDNIGGPIWDTPYYDKADTIGRLGAAQFVGIVTLHADRSAIDQSDDQGQPSTTSWEGSDEPLTSGNDQFNISKMNLEYEWISKGHKSPRHADAVQPDGKFDEPTGDPAMGTPGGFSAANGYGPYTLAPGQSVHIVIAEGASGLSRERCISVGRKYKAGTINAKAKNDSVLTGRDSLFQTFRRAIANYQSGYAIPQPPLPPATFTVTSMGDKINLSWSVTGPNPAGGFEVFRTSGRYDNPYTLIYKAGPTERSYDDTSIVRGVGQYYYIQAIGDPAENTGTGLTPPGALRSSRYFTQTFDPATLKRQPGTALSQIRIVPNPFSISSDPNALRFENEPDKIAFFEVPGKCRISIYTELGELIKEIEHTDGSGDAYWNSVTSSNQVVVSGVYIVVFENLNTGERSIQKLVIIR